jgi:hypothetical protein
VCCSQDHRESSLGPLRFTTKRLDAHLGTAICLRRMTQGPEIRPRWLPPDGIHHLSPRGSVIAKQIHAGGRAKRDLSEGKAASTTAGKFVREEIEHVREGKHGARSPQQAIAIGLSKARRAGVPLRPPARGKTSETTRKHSERDYEIGQRKPEMREEGSTKRGRARLAVMEQEPKGAVSHNALSREALSREARSAARRKG